MADLTRRSQHAQAPARAASGRRLPAQWQPPLPRRLPPAAACSLPSANQTVLPCCAGTYTSGIVHLVEDDDDYATASEGGNSPRVAAAEAARGDSGHLTAGGGTPTAGSRRPSSRGAGGSVPTSPQVRVLQQQPSLTQRVLAAARGSGGGEQQQQQQEQQQQRQWDVAGEASEDAAAPAEGAHAAYAAEQDEEGAEEEEAGERGRPRRLASLLGGMLTRVGDFLSPKPTSDDEYEEEEEGEGGERGRGRSRSPARQPTSPGGSSLYPSTLADGGPPPQADDADLQGTTTDPAPLAAPQGAPLPAMSEPSGLMGEEHVRALAAAVPARYRQARWALLYATARDGISLATLLRNAARRAPTLLVVRDFDRCGRCLARGGLGGFAAWASGWALLVVVARDFDGWGEGCGTGCCLVVRLAAGLRDRQAGRQPAANVATPQPPACTPPLLPPLARRHVFGAYCSEPWQLGKRFFGTGQRAQQPASRAVGVVRVRAARAGPQPRWAAPRPPLPLAHPAARPPHAPAQPRRPRTRVPHPPAGETFVFRLSPRPALWYWWWRRMAKEPNDYFQWGSPEAIAVGGAGGCACWGTRRARCGAAGGGLRRAGLQATSPQPCLIQAHPRPTRACCNAAARCRPPTPSLHTRYALWLDADLSAGISRSSATFGNESLAGAEEFRIGAVELWGLS